MHLLIVLFSVIAVTCGQFFNPFPFGPFGFPFPVRVPVPVQVPVPVPALGGSDEYAASLGGAPVGLYSKTRGGLGVGGGLGGSDVSSASLAGAKVGVYGKERPSAGPMPLPVPLPVPFGRPVVGRPRPSRY